MNPGFGAFIDGSPANNYDTTTNIASVQRRDTAQPLAIHNISCQSTLQKEREIYQR